MPLTSLQRLRVGLCDLPSEILDLICGHLQPIDLAVLSVQEKRLRDVASTSGVWQTHCVQRWPYCPAQLYQGDWQTMYRSRVQLPHEFVRAADSYLTAHAGMMGEASVVGSAAHLLVDAMEALFNVCAAAQCEPRLRWTREYKAVRAGLLMLLGDMPNVLMQWVRNVHASLVDDSSAMARPWEEYSWRRSAMQFAFEAAVGSGGEVHESIVRRLGTELQLFDATVEQLMRELPLEAFAAMPPPGLQKAHWWFYLADEDEVLEVSEAGGSEGGHTFLAAAAAQELDF